MDCEDDAKMQIPKYISKPCTAVVMMAKSSGPNLPFSPILLCGIRPKNPKASLKPCTAVVIRSPIPARLRILGQAIVVSTNLKRIPNCRTGI